MAVTRPLAGTVTVIVLPCRLWMYGSRLETTNKLLPFNLLRTWSASRCAVHRDSFVFLSLASISAASRASFMLAASGATSRVRGSRKSRSRASGCATFLPVRSAFIHNAALAIGPVRLQRKISSVSPTITSIWIAIWTNTRPQTRKIAARMYAVS